MTPKQSGAVFQPLLAGVIQGVLAYFSPLIEYSNHVEMPMGDFSDHLLVDLYFVSQLEGFVTKASWWTTICCGIPFFLVVLNMVVASLHKENAVELLAFEASIAVMVIFFIVATIHAKRIVPLLMPCGNKMEPCAKTLYSHLKAAGMCPVNKKNTEKPAATTTEGQKGVQGSTEVAVYDRDDNFDDMDF